MHSELYSSFAMITVGSSLDQALAALANSADAAYLNDVSPEHDLRQLIMMCACWIQFWNDCMSWSRFDRFDSHCPAIISGQSLHSYYHADSDGA